jgi:cob(I)alamin adenosyltransferase
MTKQNRISNPRTGKGDLGKSNLISGYKIRKSSSICKLQNTIQFTRNHIKLYVNEIVEDSFSLSHEDYNKIFYHLQFIDKIVNKTMNNISALAYFKFEEKEKFMIDDEFLTLLQEEIKNLCDEKLECPEFFIPQSNIALMGDNATTWVRETEHQFWIVVEEIYSQHDKQFDNYENNKVIVSTGTFLNALSDYIFIFNRFVNYAFGFENNYWENDK